MGKVIIIGATSGIGKELAKVYSKNGYEVGIVGRRETLLEELEGDLKTKSYSKKVDISQTHEAIKQIEALIMELGKVDIVIISAGIGHINPKLDLDFEQQTIDTNVSGFVAMCNVAVKCFQRQGYGHLVGISSVAAIRGSGDGPAYSASKAFVSNYLEGLRLWGYKQKIALKVTDIRPGFVDTAMAKGSGLFWVASPEKAAEQIYDAVKKCKSLAYITKRWALFAVFFRVIPGWLLRKLI